MVDPQQLKALSEKLSDEDKEALDHLLASIVSNAPAKMRLGDLLKKDGDFSKTSAILVMAWIVGLFLWVFQSLGSGAVVMEHTVPAFDYAAALAMLGAASGLYFANHKVGVQIGTPASAYTTG